MTGDELRRRFAADGFVGPLSCVDVAVVEEFEREHRSGRIPGHRNAHLQQPAAAAVCRSELLTTISTDILGPDVAIWRSAVFSGTPELSLHRDVYARNVTGGHPADRQLSVHVAITASREDNCLVIVPGSHRMSHDQLRERFGLTETRAHLSGNTRFATAEPVEAIRLTLEPGQAVFFHPMCVHGSSAKTPLSDPMDSRFDGHGPVESADRLAFVLRLFDPRLLAREQSARPIARLFRRRAVCSMLVGEAGGANNRFRPLAGNGAQVGLKGG